MDYRSKIFKKAVYEKMSGLLRDGYTQFPELESIEDEFLDGYLCDLSDQLYDAKDRLYDKLGVDDDPDIEIMLECFDKITEALCSKMYDYGAKFALEDFEEKKQK